MECWRVARLVVVMHASPHARTRVVRLSLTGRGEQVVSQAKAETGITQVALMERLLEWFAAQDPKIRTMILSPYPQVRRGLARLIVEEMQADPERDFDAMPQFDELIDHDFGSAAPTPDAAARTPKGRTRQRTRNSRS